MKEENKMVESQPAPLMRPELTVDEVAKQIDKVRELMGRVMKKDIDYGVVPGTKGKPSLFKSGSELLGKLFKLRPEYDMQITYPSENPGHIVVHTKCRLYHIETGFPMGEGVACCSSLEAKYRYRNAERKCPSCGSEAIIKGKEQYGGGWLCFKKKGGCGAKFEDDDPEITLQARGKVENENIADVHNTIIKMAAKRAKVDAIITATAASSLFTQDVEEFRNGEPGPEPKQEQKEEKPSEAAASTENGMSVAQKGKLFALGNTLSRKNNKDIKETMLSVYQILKLEGIHSSKQLTVKQASQVIDYLKAEVSPEVEP